LPDWVTVVRPLSLVETSARETLAKRPQVRSPLAAAEAAAVRSHPWMPTTARRALAARCLLVPEPVVMGPAVLLN
jgi:hypothetical protein